MKKISVMMFFFVCLFGCAMFKVYYSYNVSVKNIGDIKLRDIEITSDHGFWYRTGYLSKDAAKTLGGLKSAQPNGIYTIVVERMNKEKFKDVVDLHGEIGKGFRGEIIFLIDGSNKVTYKLEQ